MVVFEVVEGYVVVGDYVMGDYVMGDYVVIVVLVGGVIYMVLDNYIMDEVYYVLKWVKVLFFIVMLLGLIIVWVFYICDLLILVWLVWV